MSASYTLQHELLQLRMDPLVHSFSSSPAHAKSIQSMQVYYTHARDQNTWAYILYCMMWA